MRVLVLDSALARRTAALVVDGEIVAVETEDGARGHEQALPLMAQRVMMAGTAPDCVAGAAAPDCIAVTVGPGSFTGIRAGLALAHGIGLALGAPVIGVTVGEAIGDAFPYLGDRDLWIVTDSRRGHVFLEHAGGIVSVPLDAPPMPPRKVALAGGAAIPVAASLAARGANVMLTDARFPLARHIALVAERRLTGAILPRPAHPLYVDPPEARPSAGGPRPPPGSEGG